MHQRPRPQPVRAGADHVLAHLVGQGHLLQRDEHLCRGLPRHGCRHGLRSGLRLFAPILAHSDHDQGRCAAVRIHVRPRAQAADRLLRAHAGRHDRPRHARILQDPHVSHRPAVRHGAGLDDAADLPAGHVLLQSAAYLHRFGILRAYRDLVDCDVAPRAARNRRRRRSRKRARRVPLSDAGRHAHRQVARAGDPAAGGLGRPCRQDVAPSATGRLYQRDDLRGRSSARTAGGERLLRRGRLSLALDARPCLCRRPVRLPDAVPARVRPADADGAARQPI